MGGSNQKDRYFLVPAFATLLIIITLQALIHIEIWIHRASQSWTMRYQSASVTLGVNPNTSMDRAVQEMVDAVEASVGRVVSVGARMEGSHRGGRSDGRDAVGTHLGQHCGGVSGLGDYRDYREARERENNTVVETGKGSKIEHHLEVSLKVIVPPDRTGLQLLECLLTLRGATCASIAETRLNHVAFTEERDLHLRGGGGGRAVGGSRNRAESARGGRSRTEDDEHPYVGGYREIDSRDIRGLDAAHI